MNQTVSEPPPKTPSSPWPRAIVVLGVVAIVVAGGVFIAREILHAPAGLLEKAGNALDKGGARLRSVAEAFHQGTVRTEFLSRATEIAGTSRFQFATLKQSESFKREESGSTAWGLIPLPTIVVQAVAPVEYSYFLDFDGPWKFQREDDLVTVFAPSIEPNTPAMDVSALTFYTLEGSIWRHEAAVREKLRQSLTESLKGRATHNVRLVREVGRQRLADFVEKWLAEKFSDGQRFHVKVIFADEQGTAPDAKSL